MKILIVSNLYPSKESPFYGSFVKNFEDQLRNDDRVEKVDGVFLKGLHGGKLHKIWSYFFYYLKIIFYSLFFKYDIIYVHLISHSTIPLRIVNRIKKLPLIFNIHGEDLLVTTPLASQLLKFSLPLVKQAQYLVVPSTYFKRITEQQVPDYPNDRIIVSSSGGVKDIFKPIRKINDKFGYLKLGYVSRIDRGKGWDVLIEAIRILNLNNIPVELSIVGGGPQIDEMKFLIVSKNLTNVKYIGPIAHDELPGFYQNLDLFIFPTMLRESLGLVGLEAMACGIPVIGSEIGGLTDYIKNSFNGFFFTPGNSYDLANKIELFSKLSEYQKKIMSRNALSTSKDYSDKIVSKRLFDKIL